MSCSHLVDLKLNFEYNIINGSTVIIMEENSAAIECLILFYIDMKNVLKTKQVTEKKFIEQMVKHCRQSGFNKYSGEQIKNTWKTVISKYLQLKAKGSADEKENWKYFEILDSCYEQSDFHNGFHSKFSEEMIWFLIECFMKRKALKKSQKLDIIVNEIHKEFLQNGYLYLTKQDIENKWKTLNIKYDKWKNDPERLRKLPYLQALRGFVEEEPHVNMVFTKELTEILIERFTEKKITCVIHGYDSEQVLNEIQSEFKDLGFYFSKDDIQEKWRTLTNIYKFIIVKGKKETTWVYFDAMKNHFKDDFLFPLGKIDKNKINEENKPRRLRPRSKSVGAEHNKKHSIQSNPELHLDKITSDNLMLSKEQMNSSRSVKRTSGSRKRSKSRKKLKTEPKQNNTKTPNQQVNTNNQENEVLNVQENKDNALLQRNSHLSKLSIDTNQERRTSTDLGSPTSKVHIININQSHIDKESGNLTINLPSITKKFSDNEFLPLKKRLRMDGDNINKHTDLSNDKDSFRGFLTTQETADTQKIKDTCENRHMTEQEMSEIMERVNIEHSRNYESHRKVNCENFTNYYGKEGINDYQSIYNHFNQSGFIVPKEEQQDNMPMQNYSNQSNIVQPPVVLVVIKVDGGSNPPKGEIPVKMDETNKVIKDASHENNKESETRNDNLSHTQGEASNVSVHNSSDFIKVTSPKGKTIIKSKKDLLLSLEVSSDANIIYNDTSEPVQMLRHDINSEFGKINEVQESTQTLSSNSLCEGMHIENNGWSTVGETVTIYPSEDPEIMKCEEGYVASAEKSSSPTKLQVFEETLSAPTGNSIEKVRLPVKGGGKLKEIFISPRELNKIAKLKPANNNITKNFSVANDSPKNASPDFKGTQQILYSAVNETINNDKKSNYNVNVGSGQHLEDQTSKVNSKFLEAQNYLSRKSRKNEEFENESVLSEAVGDDDGLKDNLLATVIDFQEQNNQEFIEIKNLMKQNNLLQRETNRLLRLLLEKQ